MAEKTSGTKLSTFFFTFLKIGAFTFGGGYAMLALLEREFLDRRSWLTKDEFLDMTAIAESTPGPMAINSATYIGYRLAGIPGAALATLAVCIPSFVIIYLISLFFDRFLSLRLVACAFQGIQVCVVYLIGSAGWKMLKGLKRTCLNTVLMAAVSIGLVLCALFAVSFSSIWCILLCGAIGVAVWLIRQLWKGEKTT